MNMQATLLAVLLTASQLCFARSNVSIPVSPGTDGDSVLAKIPEPQQMLLDIISVTGLYADFELKEADVMNIQASITKRKRTILYNPEYVSWLNKLTRDKWSVMALIAHEVGHHLNGHTIRKGGSSPKVELEADEFAGFVLYKLGASLEEAQKVMNYIAGLRESGTHPARMDRKMAIQRGWDKAADAAAHTVAMKRN
jgi:hypothetical protein